MDDAIKRVLTDSREVKEVIHLLWDQWEESQIKIQEAKERQKYLEIWISLFSNIEF